MRLSDYDGLFYKVRNDCKFTTLAKISDEVDGRFAFFIESEKFLRALAAAENAVAAICTAEFAEEHVNLLDIVDGVAIADNPRASFFTLHNYLSDQSEEYMGYEGKPTEIDESATVDQTAVIDALDVSIGKNVRIEEHAIIRRGCTIGDGVLIRAGAIIGGTNENDFIGMDGKLQSVRAVGKVRIGEDAVVGPYSMIGKGLFPYETTVLENRVRIGYGVGVSHNAHVGSQSVVLDQSQICGNAHVGKNVRINPQAIVSNRVRIGDNAVVTIGSVVVDNVKDGSNVAGNFAIPKEKFMLWQLQKLRTKRKRAQ